MTVNIDASNWGWPQWWFVFVAFVRIIYHAHQDRITDFLAELLFLFTFGYALVAGGFYR